MLSDLLDSDKAFLKEQLRELLPTVAGRSLFLTGGTGFVGKNVLRAIQVMNQVGDSAPLSVVVLSRNPEAFLSRYPIFAGDPSIRFLQGDVRSFDWTTFCSDYVIHGASDVGDLTMAADHSEILSVNYQGTFHTLQAAQAWKASGFLLLSSGAVYGRQDPRTTKMDEECLVGPDVRLPAAAYGEGKRVAEWLTHHFGRVADLPVKVARLFAFLGPWLPMTGPFAAGNFNRDCQLNRDIEIQGDGTPIRSYLYSVELAVWLLKILFLGPRGITYNVGSDVAVSIKELAQTIQRVWGGENSVVVRRRAQDGTLAERYLPCIDKIGADLGLKPLISLDDSLVRYCNWLKGVSCE